MGRLLTFNGTSDFAVVDGAEFANDFFAGDWTLEWVENVTSASGALFSRGSYVGLAVFRATASTFSAGSSAGQVLWNRHVDNNSGERVMRLVHDTSLTGFARFRLFVNGMEVDQGSSSGSYSMPSNSGDFYIGQRGNGTTFIGGTLRDISLWSEAIYYTDSDPHPSGSRVLNLGDESGGTWTDDSTNGADATVTGAISSDPADVTIFTPNEWEGAQLDSDDAGATGTLRILGSVSSFSGTIEANHNSGSYSDVATLASEGVFFHTFDATVGTGTLNVRSKATPGKIGSVNNVQFGDRIAWGVDSNSAGRLTSKTIQHQQAASRAPATLTPDWNTPYDPFEWREGENILCDQNPSIEGSHHGIYLSDMLADDRSRPITHLCYGTGGKDVAGASNGGFAPGEAEHDGRMIPMMRRARGNFRWHLIHCGPNSAVDAVSKDDYKTAMAAYKTSFDSYSTTTRPFYLSMFGENAGVSDANCEAIRQAVVELIDDTNYLVGANFVDQDYDDGVHPKTNAQGVLHAGRWFAVLKGNTPPRVTKWVRSGTRTAVVTFDATLQTGSSYTLTCWKVGSNNPTAISASGNQVTLTMGADIGDGDTLSYAFGNSAVGAAVPMGEAVSFTTVESISSAANPVWPIFDLVRSEAEADGERLTERLISDVSEEVFAAL